MHVALRGREVLVSCELLDRSRGCTSHCEMRAERVSQSMRPARWKTSFLASLPNVLANDVLRQR